MTPDFDPDLDGPGKRAPVMIWKSGDARQTSMMWGFPPVEAGGNLVSLLRAENWEIDRPCLVIANEFGLVQKGHAKYAASLITDETFFCLAGTWRPARGDRPDAFAVLTVPAYPDLEPYKERHVAVVRPDDWYHWLMRTKSKDEILAPFPLGSFEVTSSVRGKRRGAGDLFG